MDQNNQERRRAHSHRGRRGPDRRTPPPQAQAQEHSGRDQVDVEQIMLDIRARIAQRHGIQLSNQQIQELAARRLEAILDPRSIRPSLLDELRRSAGKPPVADPAAASPLTYEFEDTTLYESHRALMRFMRRILHPFLKLFFNPNPLIRALNIQARVNTETARRETERERLQTEWNALHYELVHRMVTEVSRVTLELQGQASLIESLSAKVDFNERRVRGIEGALHHTRPPSRAPEAVTPPPAGAPAIADAPPRADAPETPASSGTLSEGARRRRRRRRGRRGSGGPGDTTGIGPSAGALAGGAVDDGPDEGPEDEGAEDEMAGGPTSQPAPAMAEAAPVTAAPEPESTPQALAERDEPAAERPKPGPSEQ